MSMAEQIRERRRHQMLTQEELGAKVGLQKSAIAKYENGRVENIKRSVLLKMADVLECTPTYLLDLEEESGMLTRKQTQWIVDFIIHIGDATSCKVIVVVADNVILAASKAANLIQNTFHDHKFYIHNIGISANQDGQDGEVFADPIGWDEDELREWRWED